MSTAGDFNSTIPRTPRVNRCPFSSSVIQEAYVLKFHSGSYLRDYSAADGITKVRDLQFAKTFRSYPNFAGLLRAEVITVHLTDGLSIRRTLLDRNVSAFIENASENPCPSDSVTRFAARLILPDRTGSSSVNSGTANKPRCAPAALKEGSNEKEERTEEQEAKEGKHQASGNSEASNGKSGRCSDYCIEKSEQAKTSAEKAESVHRHRPSFLITRPVNGRAQIEEGKRVFFDFVSTFLGVEIIAVQSGFDIIPDQFLFKNKFGSTLMLPINLMLLTREDAVEIVQNKLRSSEEKFEKTLAASV